MRFLHTADWHLGRKLHGFSLLEEQAAIFEEILAIAQAEAVDALVIAGDIYDRSVPSVETVNLYNQLMQRLNLEAGFPILAIAGNHDSSGRLATGSPWFSQTGFHLHTTLAQAFQPVEKGTTQFFLLPYFEPSDARRYFEDDQIRTVQQAMTRIVAEMTQQFKTGYQQVLVAHFFATGSDRCASETGLLVGGLDAVDATLLADFDYVALGHLHNPNALQKVANAKYSGSPLKFSLSELTQTKGVRVVDVQPNQPVKTTFHSLKPLRDIEQLTGEFTTFLSPDFYRTVNRENFLHFRLTDQKVIPNMMNRLRAVYPRVLGVERVNGLDKPNLATQAALTKQLTPEHLVAQFYQEMTGQALDKQQTEWVEQQFQQVLEQERSQ